MGEIRLSDVAARANVSIATASRALNTKPGVSELNRERVLRAAAELGYSAGAPRRSRHRSIGVIVPELHNPVFPAFAQELSTAFAARGRTVVIGTQAEDGLSEEELILAFLDQGVEGLVVVSGVHADSSAERLPYGVLASEGIPLVLVNGYVPGVDATFLSHDDEASMRTAIRHLVALGHTRIGLASGPLRYTPAKRKVDGYLAAMDAHLGVSGEESIAYSLYSVEGGAAAARELIAAGHTAIVCGSDPMAIGAIRAARTSGLGVPERVSVVGYDDSPNMAHTTPGLTTIRQAIPEMAHAAALALTASDGRVPRCRGELLFEPELIVRASTGPVPAKSTTLRRNT